MQPHYSVYHSLLHATHGRRGYAIGRTFDYDLQVAGSSPGWAPWRTGLWQAIDTDVPLS